MDHDDDGDESERTKGMHAILLSFFPFLHVHVTGRRFRPFSSLFADLFLLVV